MSRMISNTACVMPNILSDQKHFYKNCFSCFTRFIRLRQTYRSEKTGRLKTERSRRTSKKTAGVHCIMRYHSTRSLVQQLTSREAVLQGLAADGGPFCDRRAARASHRPGFAHRRICRRCPPCARYATAGLQRRRNRRRGGGGLRKYLCRSRGHSGDENRQHAPP